MGFQQLDYEVHTDYISWCLRCLRGVELTDRSLMLYLHPVAQITGFDVGANVVGHLGPPVVAGYRLWSLEAACMSGDARIVVLLNDMMPQLFVFGDIDLTVEHE
jgi:hypothetical protein